MAAWGTPVILDMDPGHDDAIAMLLALRSPEIDVRAITTVFGNQTLEKTTRNALQILTVAGARGIPVAAGAETPLVRERVIADYVHGDSGMEGTILPEPAFAAEKEHAVNVIIRLLRESEEPITLIPTGPLTNVALVLRLAPDVKEKIGGIVLMGGSTGEGNITPAAEFNIYSDAEAARIVFHSGIPLTMIGLNVTHQAMLPVERFDEFRRGGGMIGNLVADLLHFYVKFHEQVYKISAVPIHDACAVAAVVKPELFTFRKMYVDVEIRGELTYGQTVTDLWGVTGKPPNVNVAVAIDAEGLFSLLFERLSSYDLEEMAHHVR